MYFDDKMLIGKKDDKSDICDVLVFVRRDIEEVVIPSFIDVIGPYAFSNSKLEEIVIPPKVTRICECAFYSCKNLKKVTISQNSSLETIEKNAFLKASISDIQIPSHDKQ